MRTLSLLVVLLAACSDDGPASPTTPDPMTGDNLVASVDGPDLYATYCATCHGATGDGNGLAQLDRPARSFRDGGFSFGNTVTALKRTIAVGIAGSPMPGFGSALNDDQLTALAEHVRALGPETIPDAGDAAIVVVGERARVVRGQLPPLDEGQPDTPRGLLVGTPDGLSWQYDIGTMRLLAVRQGEFVERTDWVGRGGTPLKPLGRVIDVLPPSIGTFRDEDGSALTAHLVATRVDGTAAILSYDLRDSSGDRVATVRESGSATQLETCSGYERRWTLDRVSGGVDRELSFSISGESEGLSGTDAGPIDWRRASTDRGDRLYGITRPGAQVRDAATWILLPSGEATASWTMTTLLPSDSSADTLAKITEELNR